MAANRPERRQRVRTAPPRPADSLFPLVTRLVGPRWGSRGRRFKSCRPDGVMSQDIGIGPNPRVRLLCCSGWVAGLVVAGGVEDELAQELAGVFVDHADVAVLDEQHSLTTSWTATAPDAVRTRRTNRELTGPRLPNRPVLSDQMTSPAHENQQVKPSAPAIQHGAARVRSDSEPGMVLVTSGGCRSAPVSASSR